MNHIDILDSLIGFPTVSSASNLEMLAWIEETTRHLSPVVRRFPGADGKKASLFLTFGPNQPGGLLLSGHTDVVPAVGQAWRGDPFALRREGGRLIGRGATDMKGFLAVCLAGVEDAMRRPFDRPIHLALSYDEEVGCGGVGDMTDWLERSGLSPRLAIVGEPTRRKVVNAHKGSLAGWMTVTGLAGHASQPDRCVNAVMAAATAIATLEEFSRELRERPLNPAFDPPWTTLQVNTIQGGEARNIIPAACTCSWEMRMVPEADGAAILAELRDRVLASVHERLSPSPEAGLRFDIDIRIPALRPNEAEVERALLDLLGLDRAGAAPFGTEAGFFQAAGVPTVVWGPGDIADAHQPDESIAESELATCERQLGRVIDAYCR